LGGPLSLYALPFRDEDTRGWLLKEMREKLMNKVQQYQRENWERIEQLSNSMGQRIE
jgi:hypothetical protein